eukprot:6063501-Amphidinium_carterae.1
MLAVNASPEVAGSMRHDRWQALVGKDLTCWLHLVANSVASVKAVSPTDTRPSRVGSLFEDLLGALIDDPAGTMCSLTVWQAIAEASASDSQAPPKHMLVPRLTGRRMPSNFE